MAARAGAVVVEARGSHAIYVSDAKTVAGLIAKAARGCRALLAQAESRRDLLVSFGLSPTLLER